MSLGAPPSTSISRHFTYSVAPRGVTDLATVIFDGFEFFDGDDGRIVTLASNADDSEFQAFVAHATNGVNDDLRDSVIGNNGGGFGLLDIESPRIQAPLFALAPDLAGATITALALFIDAIVINPSAHEGELNWAINGQLRFIGTAPVPLPGGLLFAATALPLLLEASPRELTLARRSSGQRRAHRDGVTR